MRRTCSDVVSNRACNHTAIFKEIQSLKSPNGAIASCCYVPHIFPHIYCYAPVYAKDAQYMIQVLLTISGMFDSSLLAAPKVDSR